MTKKRNMFVLVPLIISFLLTGCSNGSSGSTKENDSGKITTSENNYYTINFNLNGGTSASYTGPKKVEFFTKDVFFFDCVKEGWNFRGWSYNGTKIFDEKGNQLANPTMSRDMTFTAMYAQTAKMTIITNLEGAGTIKGDGEYPYNTDVDVSAYPKNNFIFVGWYYENTLLSNTNVYRYKMWDRDVTLEARFKHESYLMNIHTNNSEYGLVLLKSSYNRNYLPQYEEERECNSQVQISAYSNTSVRFLGWYNTNNNLASTNAAYEFVMPNYDYTLEAKWNYFTITYELNGGVNSPNNPSSYTIEDGDIQLYSPTRNGYAFKGWTQNGRYVDYIDSYQVSNITLTAVWEKTTYTITYVLNGGTNNPNNPSTYRSDSNTITLLSPSRNGYNFSGWFRDSNFTNQIKTIAKGSSGDLTIYAKWSPIEYSILYELNGGTNNPNNPSTYTIESNIILNAPTKNGYTFLGWYEGTTNIQTIKPGRTGTITLTAHWNEGNEYTITLDPNGGTISQTSLNVQFDHQYSLPIPDERLGYSFSGWYDGDTLVNNSGTWKISGNTTLIAKWILINYKINYVLNGGINNPDNPSTYTIDDNVILNNPSREGYTFDGWYTDSSFKTKIESIDGNSCKDYKIYAKWTANTYTIILDYGGGQNCPTVNFYSQGKIIKNVVLYKDSTLSYFIPDAPDENLKFAGWYTDSSYKNAYSFNGTVNADLNLYAKWADVSDYTYSDLGNSVNVQIDGNQFNYIVVNSLIEQTITISSSSGLDLYGAIYDSNWKELASCDDISDTDLDFSITITLEAGKTYYIAYKANQVSTTGACVINITGTQQPDVFITGGETIVEEVNVTYGKSFNLPTPHREGYIFVGWFDENGNKIDTSKWSYSQNMTIYAHWIPEN